MNSTDSSDRPAPDKTTDSGPVPLVRRPAQNHTRGTDSPDAPSSAGTDSHAPDTELQGTTGNNKKILLVSLAGVATIVGALMVTLPSQTDRRQSGQQVFRTEGRPVLGNRARGGEVILFADYSCPACRQLEETQIKAITRELVDTGQAHVIFMQSPFINESSHRAALAAECVYRTGGNDVFWRYTKTLYDQQGAETTDWATPALLKAAATDLNVDPVRYTACIRGTDAQAAVDADLAQHRAAGMQGTPAVFVNGYRTPAGGRDIQNALKAHPPGGGS